MHFLKTWAMPYRSQCSLTVVLKSIKNTSFPLTWGIVYPSGILPAMLKAQNTEFEKLKKGAYVKKLLPFHENLVIKKPLM